MERKVNSVFVIDNYSFVVKEVEANKYIHCSECALRTVKCFSSKYLFAGRCYNRNDGKYVVFKIIKEQNVVKE